MQTQKINISKIQRSENNPRTIRDDKFAKLVQSIREFPQMLELRPIVVDENMIILGGNMRFEASKKAGLKELPIIKYTVAEHKKSQAYKDGQTYKQACKEFIIKDNISFGQWDWDVLANEWDSKELNDWGMDVWVDNREEDGFSPRVEPIFGKDGVTKDDIIKAQEQKDVKFKNAGKILVDVICPECGHEFKIEGE